MPRLAQARHPRFLQLLVAAALAVGVALRTSSYLADRSLWLDPAMLALNLIAKSPGELLGKLDWNQAAPPGFLLLAKLAGFFFDYQEASLKFWPWVASLASLGLLLPLVTRLVGTRHAIVAILPFATCSTAIFYAGEFKQYSCDLTATVLILLAYSGVLAGEFSRAALTRFGAACLVSAWISHSSPFVVGGCSIALLIALGSRPNRQLLMRTASAMAIVGLHGIALYSLQVRPALPADLVAVHSDSLALPSSLRESISAGSHLLMGYFRFPLGFHFTVLPAIVACVVGLLRWSRNRRELANQVALTAPLALLTAATTAGIYPIYTGANDVNARFALFTVPLILILSARGVARTSRASPMLGAALGILLTASAIPAIWSRPSVIEQEMRPLTAHLAQAKEPGDVVYVFHAAIPAFEYYTRRSPVVYVPGASASGLTANLSGEVDLLSTSSRVWLVFAHDFEGARANADRGLRRTHRRSESHTWPGASLDLYVMKVAPSPTTTLRP